MSSRGVGAIVGLLLIAVDIAVVVPIDRRPDSDPGPWRTEPRAPDRPGIGVLLPRLRLEYSESENSRGCSAL